MCDDRYLHGKPWKARVHDKVPVVVALPFSEALKKRRGFLADHWLARNR